MDKIVTNNHKFYSIDPYKFERENLPKCLTEEQYTRFLMILMQKKSQESAFTAWADLKKLNITQQYDSSSEVPRFIDYYLAHNVTFERYKKERDQREKSLKALDKNMPTLLHRLKTAKADSSGTKRQFKGTFQW